MSRTPRRPVLRLLSLVAAVGVLALLPVAGAAAKDGESESESGGESDSKSDSGSDSKSDDRSSDDRDDKDRNSEREKPDDKDRDRSREDADKAMETPDQNGRDDADSRRRDGRRLSTDEVFAGVRSGDFVPLSSVMATVRRSEDGEPAAVDLYVADDGRAVYEIVVVAPTGRLVTVRVDARTNRLLEVRARR